MAKEVTMGFDREGYYWESEGIRYFIPRSPDYRNHPDGFESYYEHARVVAQGAAFALGARLFPT